MNTAFLSVNTVTKLDVYAMIESLQMFKNGSTNLDLHVVNTMPCTLCKFYVSDFHSLSCSREKQLSSAELCDVCRFVLKVYT